MELSSIQVSICFKNKDVTSLPLYVCYFVVSNKLSFMKYYFKQTVTPMFFTTRLPLDLVYVYHTALDTNQLSFRTIFFKNTVFFVK